jgi:lysophospholipase L1-like esterase
MNKKIRIIIIIVGGFLAVNIIVSLVIAGINFVGPLKELAAIKIMVAYNADKRSGEIVFYGASNFGMWTDMEKDLSAYKVQNHGFGGTTDKDLVHYANKLLYPYKPAVVFFQTGSNDYIAAQGTEEEKVNACVEYKRWMFAQFHEKMPETVFVVMSGLLLPGRNQYKELTMEVNRHLKVLCDENSYMFFVDTSEMTYTGSMYREELFLKDGIHLNRDGQLKWAVEFIIPAIEVTSHYLEDKVNAIYKNAN